MAQVINTNSLSLLTQNNLNKSQSALGSAIERLSSGLRINSAKDDAAGQAIANRFTANIKGLTQASRNANDGISVAQTTEGALSEINNNLQRVRELSVQAANGSNSDSDLSSIQDEINQRLEEINRVSQQTDFNGKKVLNQDGQLTIQVGAKDGETITIDLKKINSETLKLDDLDVTKIATTLSKGAKVNTDVAVAAGVMQSSGAAVTWGGTPELYKDPADGKSYIKDGTKFYSASVDNKAGTITYDPTELAGADLTKAQAAAAVPANKVNNIQKEVAFTGAGLGAGESVITYKDTATNKMAYAIKQADNTYEKVTFDAAGAAVKGTGGLTPDISLDPLKKIDDALSDVDKFRSSLGAIQNRFESAITNLGNTVNNLSSARSRIEDSDYATEVSNMSRAQILQQAGTSVLAQANQTTQNVLSLLR
ncbi:FliC/FljB family flagellin [Citrobacter werkmanii]|uniref:FliC/FljB family flagellin n=1 Tax=Citrobacter werkmanii TaxID=67827 RepID=UPI001D0A2829|nr:FliC/FljB family flagellin [Citrobacter werkmanii]UBX46578.1 FliC/FljB family flagellin [Citrobacter werkmanii]